MANGLPSGSEPEPDDPIRPPARPFDPRVQRRQLVDYAGLALIWGVLFVLVLHAVGAFGWAATVAFRSLLASAILLVRSVVTGRRLQFRSSWAGR